MRLPDRLKFSLLVLMLCLFAGGYSVSYQLPNVRSLARVRTASPVNLCSSLSAVPRAPILIHPQLFTSIRGEQIFRLRDPLWITSKAANGMVECDKQAKQKMRPSPQSLNWGPASILPAGCSKHAKPGGGNCHAELARCTKEAAQRLFVYFCFLKHRTSTPNHVRFRN